MIKIAIIGYGKQGQKMAEACQKVMGISIMHIESTRNLDFPIDGLDAVIVATPPDTHFMVSEPFLKKGLKVFIEKPLCVSLEDLKKFKSYKRQIMVGDKFAYSDIINTMKEKNKGSIPKFISSEWKKSSGDDKIGPLLDLGYHHMYLHSFLCDEVVKIKDKSDFYILGKTKKCEHVMTFSFNQFKPDFSHKLDVYYEDKSYIIYEKNGTLYVRGEDFSNIEKYDNLLVNELKYFVEFVEKEKSLKIPTDMDIDITKELLR